ncbi:membrane-bound PQQ-dependent dehydrogenase, glucose/quinate/shikimate family [Alloalcanivorax xenomutans]|uniref:membrane-bound PQQ-dependent dehydrogenase, glucose/quinate/shikimate family n=1 Tax=Alloalcanivorax xenomutans TaxID=1094342 RepID=UPI00292E2513|nr:membrane-bound PQQ-dependent dehydrogenase, glucose/quinate/shikimate family [Alloalcanivorax xenomutans]WOA32735.1 membrane-bound PQQ-dependent dehydrogenase, glucose/quinate/shikimate family [Alloalcanivorax xenomutans]
MNEKEKTSSWVSIVTVLVGLLMIVAGIGLLGGGIYLILLGGSWYFSLAGIGLVISGGLVMARHVLGFWLYAVVFMGTALWAWWEVGLDFWPQVSRLFAPAVLLFLLALLAPALRRGKPISGGTAYPVAAVILLGLAATIFHAFYPGPIIASKTGPPSLTVMDQAREWHHYGRQQDGTRYAPQDQITPDNVDQLEVVWTFRTGDIPNANPPGAGGEDQNTPIQVGDTLYVCTVHNKVFALDADSGEQKWSFDPEASSPLWQRCRGLGYYQASNNEETCAGRIVLSTIDARLIELDAQTGALCPSFGDGGTVDLKQGMGEVKPGFYFQTSAPTVARGLIIIGGWVFDNMMTGEPSGVIRAFRADSGELAWAWDLANPALTGLPAEGETYTRGTPNVWSTPAVDEELGLIYLPTGNATPDFYGGHRTDADEDYSSSIVALDLHTGRERWKFQTVHHDIWDYDVPSQPALFDVDDGNGNTVPALIQTTKRGQIFMLDRRTGTPIAEVEERPVPQGAVDGDWTSPTQPYSVGMPAIGAEKLSEAAMWGATPFDQLYCRIQFRKLRYEGDFTPPGLTPSLQWPGYFGGMNWGSNTIYKPGGYLIVNDTRSPQRVLLVPREEADKEDASASHTGLSPQHGTPYGASKYVFMSPLGVPCQKPPYGTLSAIDLNRREVVWQIPLGTVEDTGPLGLKMHLPIPVGMPTVGGPMSTASGLVFYAGTLDYNIRAMDVASGETVWKHRLPVGSQGTPMTYISPASGKQYLVISAGGSRQSPDRGDYIVAFALPDKQNGATR